MPLKKLRDVAFPVYRLRAHDELYTNPLGIRIIATPYREWALDDTNLDEPYAIRRIRMKSAGREVYPLNDKYDTFSDVVHKPSGTVFIDSEGDLFEYNKAGKYWNLQYYEIDYMELIDEGIGTIVWVRGISVPFIFYTILNTQLKYIGLLDKHGMFVAYDLSFEKKPNSRRML